MKTFSKTRLLVLVVDDNTVCAAIAAYKAWQKSTMKLLLMATPPLEKHNPAVIRLLHRQAQQLGIPDDEFDCFVVDFYRRSIRTAFKRIGDIRSGFDEETYPGEQSDWRSGISEFAAAYYKYGGSRADFPKDIHRPTAPTT